MIAETIVAEVKKAKFFSVISGEVDTWDVHKEETTGDYAVKESFIGFKEQHCQQAGGTGPKLWFSSWARLWWKWINGRKKKRSKQYNITKVSLGNIYSLLQPHT